MFGRLRSNPCRILGIHCDDLLGLPQSGANHLRTDDTSQRELNVNTSTSMTTAQRLGLGFFVLIALMLVISASSYVASQRLGAAIEAT